jgi:hypothetical protein
MRRAGFLVVLIAAIVLASGASAAAPRSGIVGKVVEGPTCPVERMPPDPRCAPRPVQARVRITRQGPRSHTLIVETDSKGHFRVRLAPGIYVVQGLPRSGSSFPRPPASQRVTVSRGHYTAVTLSYDTGIR